MPLLWCSQAHLIEDLAKPATALEGWIDGLNQNTLSDSGFRLVLTITRFDDIYQYTQYCCG